MQLLRRRSETYNFLLERCLGCVNFKKEQATEEFVCFDIERKRTVTSVCSWTQRWGEGLRDLL